MKLYAFRHPDSMLSTLGVMTLTNEQAAQGQDPEGVDGVTAVEMWGQYRGRLRKAVAIYGAVKVRNIVTLVPVLEPVLNTTLWTVDLMTYPAAAISQKFLPDLRQPNRLPILELIDESGLLIRTNNGATIRRVAAYIYNASYPTRYRLGIGGTGITSAYYFSPFRSKRGKRRDSASQTSISQAGSSGNITAWMPTVSFTKETAATDMYKEIGLRCNNSSAEFLIVDADHPLALQEGGRYLYASDAAGTTPITTVTNYVKFWLLESIYPYTGT